MIPTLPEIPQAVKEIPQRVMQIQPVIRLKSNRSRNMAQNNMSFTGSDPEAIINERRKEEVLICRTKQRIIKKDFAYIVKKWQPAC
jgi:hypothetical protein